MKKAIMAVLSLVLLCACATSPEGIAVNQESQSEVSQASLPTYTPLPTYTALPTYTPFPTSEPSPTNTSTPIPSATPYPTNTAYPTNTPPPQIGSRMLPVPLGTMFEAFSTASGAEYEITISEVVSGEEAWNEIRAANMFNDPPPEGTEYVLFWTSLKIVSGPEDEAISWSDSDWTLVRADGKIEDLSERGWVVAPEPGFDGQGFPGATIEGWSCFTRPPGEKVLLVLGMDYSGKGGLWFALE